MTPTVTKSRSNCVFIVSATLLAFLAGCQSHLDKVASEPQVKEMQEQTQMLVENGEAFLRLDQATQTHLVLSVAVLVPTVTRGQITAPAVVLPVQELATSRNSFITAETQLQKSHIETEVAQKEYTRLQALFAQDHNVSEKSLQSAEGVLKASEADELAGQQQLSLQKSLVRQEWGRVASEWALEDSLEFHRILDQQDVLVQVTIQGDSHFRVPQTVLLEARDTTRIAASLVSPFPRVDPRVQGRSFLYLANADRGLSPGMYLLAHLLVGAQLRGLIVPTSAVVWSEGKPWLYLQTASDRFSRRPVATDVPVENGFFVSQGFAPGDKVVTQGAQVLLSEEMLLRGQRGGETDEN